MNQIEMDEKTWNDVLSKGNSTRNYFESEKGKNTFVIQFKPISMDLYLGERKKVSSLPKDAKVITKHVASCHCQQCRAIKSKPRKEASRVYYHASIRLVQAVMEASQVYYLPSHQNWNLLWTAKIVKPSLFENLLKHQRINQFPKSSEVTRKDYLSKNVSMKRKEHGRVHFDFLSNSYIIPKEKEALKVEWENNPDVAWIVKPVAAACGRGVFITKDFDDFPVDGLDDFVVEKYIENPLLLNGYKFDLRLYVAVLSFNPLRIYLHDEGLARLATEQYNPNLDTSFENRYMHLTNYSINKHNERQEEVEQQNDEQSTNTKWTLLMLKEHLENQGVNTVSTWKRIEDMVIKTILSMEGKVARACARHVPHQNNCFELFGFDILLDDDLKPWLLEVNLSSSLACDTELDLRVKSSMLSDLFNLAGISPHELPGPASAPVKKSKAKIVMDADFASQQLERNNRADMKLIRQVDDEHRRCGRFKRIFPTGESYLYAPFFDSELPRNTLMMDMEYVRAKGKTLQDVNLDTIHVEQSHERRRKFQAMKKESSS